MPGGLFLFVVKNIGAKPIKVVEWDFAFLRYENGQFLSRYYVTTKVGIKPGGKKTLKHKLPPGAKRCGVVKVISDKNQPENFVAFEAVCGKGFHDPSLLNQKQETISINRIEFADGSVWLK
jgi:Haemolysin-type calcium binding protein related domain